MGRMKFENNEIDDHIVEVDFEKTIGLIKQISKKKLIEKSNALSIDERVENNKLLVDLMDMLVQAYQHKLTQSNYDTILRLCDEFNIQD